MKLNIPGRIMGGKKHSGALVRVTFVPSQPTLVEEEGCRHACTTSMPFATTTSCSATISSFVVEMSSRLYCGSAVVEKEQVLTRNAWVGQGLRKREERLDNPWSTHVGTSDVRDKFSLKIQSIKPILLRT